MRISDWSSDVCSSDLLNGNLLSALSGAGLKGFEMTRHFLNLSDAGGAAIAAMLNVAQERKAKRAKWPKGSADADMPLDGNVLGLLVEKNSTHTRVPFAMAIRTCDRTSTTREIGGAGCRERGG